MSLTTDPNDPRLGHGVDAEPIPQHDVYLVLPEEELQEEKFVRPVRYSYKHVGKAAPKYELRDLSDQQRESYGDEYAKYEAYPESEQPKTGRYWTQKELDAIGKGCGSVTTMGATLSETYARSPYFYGATYCCACRLHLAVGEMGEFIWIEKNGLDGPRVGT